MVRLRYSLSSPSRSLLRLYEELEELHNSGGSTPHEAVIAQTGAVDAGSVRLRVKANRKLSPAQVAELIDGYKAGTSQAALCLQFGTHEQTVRAHLRRHGVTIRPVRLLTEHQEREVVRLYVEELLTLDDLAAKFKVSDTTVRNVLVRRGVARRGRERRPVRARNF